MSWRAVFQRPTQSLLRTIKTTGRQSRSIHTQPNAVDQPVFLTLSSLYGKKIKDQVVALDPTVFNHPIRRDILHLCAVHHLDAERQGTASTKTRAEVRGSGRKIRPQKGTGRARLGDGQSPMLRGGGVAFGPKPRDFSTRLNRKVIQMGMRVALSAKLREQRLGIVRRLHWYCLKTRTLKRRLDLMGWTTGTLFVTGESQVHPALRLAGRNLPGVEFKPVSDLRVYDLIKWRRVILDIPAVQMLERTLSKGWVAALEESEAPQVDTLPILSSTSADVAHGSTH
ncbi:ribosomal protein L4 domain-containing protein [Scleroderma yunnanense]